MDFPVFFGDERTDRALTLHDQLHGDGLHPTRRQTAGDLLPQQRGNHVTHDAVEEATRLLGIDAIDVQLSRFGEGFLNRLLGDLVEHHALVTLVVTADGFAQVPGNGFPFAVQVRREIDGVGILGQAAQFVDHLLLAGKDFVLGFPAMLGIDAHPRHELALGLFLGRQRRRFRRGLAALGSRLFGGTRRTAGGQVSDMADTRLHHVLAAQILVDGLGLSRGFHNDQRFAHGSENS